MIFGLFILLPAGCDATDPMVFSRSSLTINRATYRVELARTSAERQRGLMYRENLERDAGMLFVYGADGDHRIWMKNTRISLQVIWIDSDFRVISLLTLKPCVSETCAVFSGRRPSRYILELSDHERSIKPGDRVKSPVFTR